VLITLTPCCMFCRLHDVLTPEECDHLVGLVRPHLAHIDTVYVSIFHMRSPCGVEGVQ
jgi:hypothetical protein